MYKKIHKTALAAALTAAFPALAQTSPTLPVTLAPVVVTANGISTKDSDATYASEVHDRAAIEASGATNLVDYLSQHSSLNVSSSYGNRNAPSLDMRGYGVENGYQAIAITVDGRRVNNVDMANPLLGSIPLSAIESIEISKGTGSVTFGDGAMAGAIQIRTRAFNGASVSAVTGSRGMQSLTANAGISREFFDLSVTAAHDKQGYSSDLDVVQHRDGSDNRTEQAKLTLKPVDGLRIFLDGMSSRVDTRYVGPLTPTEFNNNPRQNSGNTYNHQLYEVSQARVGVEYQLSQALTARYTHNREDRMSDFVTFASRSNYDYSSDDASLAYRSSKLDLKGGFQRFMGERISTSNRTSKDNTAFYLQGIYRFGALSLSAGGRQERVKYVYAPTAGTSLHGEHELNGWDLGANYRFTEQVSTFVNYNSAFQAPDIDRFFTFAGAFNGFIQPAKARTINIGVNHDTARNRLRAALFYSKLDNEIYLDPFTFNNTNIDKSHKSGLELQDRWQVRDSLSLALRYTYTRAVIDTEGTLSGKAMPGVPRHGVTLGVNYKPWESATLNLNHVWRDSAYAMNDLSNNLRNRQSIYSSTNLNFRQRFGKFEGFLGVDNLFDRANGLWVSDTAVYPIDFRRTWKVGIKADLI